MGASGGEVVPGQDVAGRGVKKLPQKAGFSHKSVKKIACGFCPGAKMGVFCAGGAVARRCGGAGCVEFKIEEWGAKLFSSFPSIGFSRLQGRGLLVGVMSENRLEKTREGGGERGAEE